MNKSKFKSVKFKPTNTMLYSLYENDCNYYWQSGNIACAGIYGHIQFIESFIEHHPELFEVELAEREFNEGAWYKAQYYKGQPYEIVKFRNGKFKRNGLVDDYPPLAFEEIGDKVL